jgi:energy-coupling factor transport system substrate-specific component
MTWQLGSFAVLAVGLIAGFAWYERGRPDAKIVALVGTLAALGALGRIAFAAVPNVKPTTDIVLIAGYALGGGPGYVVGALSALVSNFFFGQGPWTPWQMAGWGITGVIGAGLVPLTRGRIHRWPLALVCFVVGFAFTALQDCGDWVTYSDHSLGQLGVYVGKGVGFDLIHATGCLVFALLFGPALIRSLQRFRLRLNVKWIPRASPRVVPPVVLLLAALVVIPSLIRAAPASANGTPAGYLESAKLNSTLYIGWAALGLEADGIRPPQRMLTYIEDHEATDPGSIERTILALRGAGVSTGEFARLQHDIERDGSVAQQTNLTAFAVLAYRADGQKPPAKTLSWLAAQQDSDGGFNFATRGAASDVDDTGAALEALRGSAPAKEIDRAVRFIDGHQNRDGGFPSESGGSSNAQSTAFAIQGLVAAGVHPTRAIAYLRSLVQPSGAIDYSKGDAQSPVWVTGEALMGLAGKPLPFAPLKAFARRDL